LQAEHVLQSVEISILLTGDEHIHQLNKGFRGVDRPTDVLAFPQLEGQPAGTESVGPVLLGDVVISVETAKRQARERNRPLDDEVALLVVHGVLHLLGYSDETEDGAAEMRNRERAALESIEDGKADSGA